jgi:flagellar basal body-associated protein FliL
MDKQQSEAIPATEKQTPKTHNSLKLILIIACVLLAAAAVGAYFWQHHKVTTLSSQLNSQSSQLASQSNKISALQGQLANIEKGALTNLAISVNHASRFDVFGAGTTDDVSVSVTIKNQSTSAATIDTSAFKLKDTQNNTYQSYKDAYGAATVSDLDRTLPSGETLLTDQPLAAGETVTGSLVYRAHNTLSNFMVVYGSQSTQVTIK